MAKESATSRGGREHTHEPQLGMNINTSPTQLASGVGLGDSGRVKEEAPLVADDVAMDEDEDDDGTQQYVYTGAYSGFERHVLVGDDDETPRWLGDCCNGWVLLWPKSLLHLEAVGSTPTSRS